MTTTNADFTTLTLNLRFGLADDGANSWPNRIAAYRPLLNAHPADFLAFQEANDFQVDALCHILPTYRVVGLRPDAPDRWQHNPIFYHPDWQCLSTDHFYLSRTPDTPSQDPDSRWPRQCTIGRFVKNGSLVTVINTHFDFSDSVQLRSARLIRNRLGANRPSVPELLMGDFNTIAGSLAWQALTRDSALPGDLFVSAMPEPALGTFHNFTGRADGRAIDWVLYRGAVRPRQVHVIQDCFEGFYPSDHYPIEVHWAYLPTR